MTLARTVVQWYMTAMRQTKTRYVKLRVTERQLEQWQALADSAGLTLSEWARLRINGVRKIEVPSPKAA